MEEIDSPLDTLNALKARAAEEWTACASGLPPSVPGHSEASVASLSHPGGAGHLVEAGQHVADRVQVEAVCGYQIRAVGDDRIDVADHPARELWTYYRPAVLRGFCLIAAGSLAFNTFFIFMPT